MRATHSTAACKSNRRRRAGWSRVGRDSYAHIGVLSTQPGISLGGGSAADPEGSGPQLALVGRVPVKVTAAGGPIRPGDLLVASSLPGHAMRGPLNPAPGTVIGKALEPLARGTGVIQMLVMLR